MKICCLIDSLGSGGAQRQMAELVKALVQRGHETRLLVYHPHLNHFQPDVEAVGVQPEAIVSQTKLGRIRATRKLVRADRPDCIISFLHTPNLLGVAAAISPSRIPLIVSERSLDTDGKNRSNRIRFNAFRFADRVVTNSYSQANFIAEYFPFLKSKTVVVANSVDLDRFRPRSDGANNNSELRRLIVAARVEPVKNASRLIEALRLAKHELVKEGSRLRIEWFGNTLMNGDQPTPEAHCYLAAVEQIAKVGLEDDFVFHGAVDNIQDRLGGHDGACLASTYEGCPNAICEAMASGLPVVASNISDLKVMLGENAFLFDPLDVNDMAAKLVAFARTPSERLATMGKQLRQAAENRFSPQSFADAYEQLVREVVK